jgi:hypothetical protein
VSGETVVSLATGRGRYPEALARLRESLETAGFRGRALLWEPERFPAGCPPHEAVPFAFKPFCFREALAAGCGPTLWLDSACVLVRDPGQLFADIAARGAIVFRNADWRLGEWASDEALAALALDRESALALPEVDAAALGLDLRHPVGRAFLDGWLAAAADGVAFRGTLRPLATASERLALKWNRGGLASADPRVRGHRHDQTVAGVLAHRLGLEPRVRGLQKYSSRRRAIAWRTLVVVDRDVGRDDGAPLRPVAAIRRDLWLGALVEISRRSAPSFGAAPVEESAR